MSEMHAEEVEEAAFQEAARRTMVKIVKAIQDNAETPVEAIVFGMSLHGRDEIISIGIGPEDALTFLTGATMLSMRHAFRATEEPQE